MYRYAESKAITDPPLRKVPKFRMAPSLPCNCARPKTKRVTEAGSQVGGDLQGKD